MTAPITEADRAKARELVSHNDCRFMTAEEKASASERLAQALADARQEGANAVTDLTPEEVPPPNPTTRGELDRILTWLVAQGYVPDSAGNWRAKLWVAGKHWTVGEHWFIGTVAPEGKGEYCVHIAPMLRHELAKGARYPVGSVEPKGTVRATPITEEELAACEAALAEHADARADWFANMTGAAQRWLCEANNRVVALGHDHFAKLVAAARLALRAMPVVDATAAFFEKRGVCFFCEYWPMSHEHGESCPLVVSKFITREGRRIE